MKAQKGKRIASAISSAAWDATITASGMATKRPRVPRTWRVRKDSWSDTMEKERLLHLERLNDFAVNVDLSESIAEMGLGQRRISSQHDSVFQRRFTSDGKLVKGSLGAGGFSYHLGASDGGKGRGWPVFKHRLPEVAFAGLTNSGKSSLLNALAGIAPKRGPAGVCDRAGWTDCVNFYRVGRKPPVMIFVDLPGYGHAAAATKALKRSWCHMIWSYLSGERKELFRCCVLVDCTRGLTDWDWNILNRLHKKGIEHQIVLTKCDMLDPDTLTRWPYSLNSLYPWLHLNINSRSASRVLRCMAAVITDLSLQPSCHRIEELPLVRLIWFDE